MPAPVAARARRPELDALRVAAMAGVVAIHTLGWPLAKAKGSAWYLGFLVADRVANAVCVPAFLFLTGLLVWGSRRRRAPHGLLVVAAHRASCSLPYLAWSAVYYVVRPLLYPPAAGRRARGLADAAVRVIAGTTCYHLYFPPLLLAVYLLAPARAAACSRAGPRRSRVATLVAQALLVAAHHGVPMPPEAREFVAHAALLVPFASAGAWFAAMGARAVRPGGAYCSRVGRRRSRAGGRAGVRRARARARTSSRGYPLRLVGMLAVGARRSAAALALLGRHDWERRPRLTRWLRGCRRALVRRVPGAPARARIRRDRASRPRGGQRAWGRPPLFARGVRGRGRRSRSRSSRLRRSPVTSWTV